MPLHPGQIKYLEDTHRLGTKINVLVPSNRWGKTSLAACLQIWYHFYKFGVPTGSRKAWVKAAYRTANVAPRASLVEPLFNYIDQIMSSSFPINLPDGRLTTNKCQIEWFYLKDQTRENPVHKQFFAFNSYIEHRTLGATAADSLEGKPFGLITYDEGGRSMHLQEEVSGTILARLFDWNGPLHLISTPDQGSPSLLYHKELFDKGRLGNYAETDTYSMEGALRDNIFFPIEQIEKQYKLYENDPLRDQVIEGKFVFGGDNIFNPDDLLAMQTHELDDGIRFIPGHKYVIGTDTSMASDEFVETILDITDFHVKRLRTGQLEMSGTIDLVQQRAAKGNSKSPQRHLNDFMDLVYSYKEGDSIRHLLETWNGESARFYLDLPYDIQLITKCYGSWQPERIIRGRRTEKPKNQNIKKADIILALQKIVSMRMLRIFKNDPNMPGTSGANLIQQMTIYKEQDENLPQDRVISLALAAYLAVQPNTFPAPLQFVDVD